jgi:hypothetical protein
MKRFDICRRLHRSQGRAVLRLKKSRDSNRPFVFLAPPDRLGQGKDCLRA